MSNATNENLPPEGTPKHSGLAHTISKLAIIAASTVIAGAAMACTPSSEEKFNKIQQLNSKTPPKTPREAAQRCEEYCETIKNAIDGVIENGHSLSRAGDNCTAGTEGIKAVQVTRDVCKSAIKHVPLERVAEFSEKISKLNDIEISLRSKVKDRLGRLCIKE